MRERLIARPAPIICEKIFAPAIREEHQRSFFNMVRLNLAHVLMLEKQNIIKEESARELAGLLLKLYQTDGTEIGSDCSKEDYYFNFEQYVISQCGMETGGALHTARSRNDLNSTLIRMNVREELFHLWEKLEKLIHTILALAKENTETVMTGYTHMQPAQPITFAHYLTGISEALYRDLHRLQNAYAPLNAMPLGACAFAGTSFKIDRSYMAQMLGFDEVLLNTVDGVASRDYLMEIAADCTILGTTIGRFAGDLYIWSTDEFQYVEVDDSMACCSSIMPQKKNPLVLEHVKAKAAHLMGGFTDLTMVLRGTPYSHCRDLSEMLSPFWKVMEETELILDLMQKALETLHIKKNVMQKRVNTNFSTVTELADALVKEKGISFREAHHLVGNLVLECVERGVTTKAISAESLEREYRHLFGLSCGWTDEKLKNVLDGRASVANRISEGAPSPDQCVHMIRIQEKALESMAKERERRREHIDDAYAGLLLAGSSLTDRRVRS